MNTNHIVRFIHRLAAITIVASFALVPAAHAQANAQMETHNPYTVRGLQIRTNLIPEETTSAYSAMEISASVGPTLFQEMVPCRFVSTLDHHLYPVRWGGQPFQVSERRVYHPIGYLVEGQFKNPCSELIPSDAVALSVRIAAYQPGGNGSVYLGPASIPTYNRAALRFSLGNDAQQEANVVLEDKSFVVAVADQSTELTIDIIGFFIPDPLANAAKGDKGERGERGEMGSAGPKGDSGVAGAQGTKGDKGDKGDNGFAGAKGEKGDNGDDGVAGAKGEKGDDGVAGAKGEKGDKGDDGVTGAKGEKGDKGDRGENGAQGLKGDRGENGLQGLQGLDGDKGDRGEIGPHGLQGFKGEKGDKGDRGENGLQGTKGDKGDRGENGAQGLKGDRGENGAQGLKGDKGDKGLNGETGPAGAVGSKGDKGDKGAQGDKGVKGDKGDKGDTGATGPKGECSTVPGPAGPKGPTGSQGPSGPQGPAGPQGPKGESSCGAHVEVSYCSTARTIGSNGSAYVSDNDVKSSSVIMLTYYESAGSIPLAVVSQNSGSFTVSGSSNKKFKYVIINP